MTKVVKEELGFTQKQKLQLDKIEKDIRDGKRSLYEFNGLLLSIMQRRLKKEN